MENNLHQHSYTPRRSIVTRTALAGIVTMMFGMASDMSQASQCRDCFLECDAADNGRLADCRSELERRYEECECGWFAEMFLGCESTACRTQARDDNRPCERESEEERRSCVTGCANMWCDS
jgi:hypothetical protein